MAARKTTVTHADGTVSTRKSQSRTYAYAVEVSPASAEAYAAYLIRQAEAVEAQIAKYRAAADAGVVTIRSRGFHTVDDYYSHQITLSDTDRDIYSWSNAKGEVEDRLAEGRPIVGGVAYLTAYARSYADDLVAHAEKYRARAAETLAAAQPVGTYHVARWSATHANASKGLREFEHYVGMGHGLRVVPVDAA